MTRHAEVLAGPHTHRGIPCRIRDPKMCRAISRALSDIERGYPRDLARICRLVESFEPQPKSELEKGNLGAWNPREA